MRSKPTIATVAAHAGVAVSTVSRYLNGHYVSKTVRSRLAEVIEELGYSRSWVARNLSLRRRGSVGVVVDSSQDPWFIQLLLGIQEELSTRDTSLMLASLELRGRYDPTIVFEWIRERRVDGLIIAKSQRRERSLIKEAIQTQLPVVLVAPDEAIPHTHVIRCDNRNAGIAVANHLADLGHTRVAFAGGPRHSLDSRCRLRGLRDGLATRGIPLSTANVFFCDSYGADFGSRFATKFLRRRLEVTALVMGSDALALGFMRVARQRGIRVPADLSVVGFDNVPASALLWPGLTTMEQPTRKMGSAACKKLFEAIATGGDSGTETYPMSLIVRESTSAPLPSSLRAAAD